MIALDRILGPYILLILDQKFAKAIIEFSILIGGWDEILIVCANIYFNQGS